MSKNRKAEAHVRIYRHELECEAYRSLSTDARALLVEFRALYGGKENRVYMSLREIMRRLGVGRCRAEKARDEVLDRGFLRLIEPASFTRKVKHAPVYALTNEPLNPSRDGATAPKDFMSWKPGQKSTVLTSGTDGAGHQHRDQRGKFKKAPLGAGHQHREASNEASLGAGHQHTDRLPPTPCVSDGPESLLWGALAVDGEAQFKFCLAALLESASHMEAAA